MAEKNPEEFTPMLEDELTEEDLAEKDLAEKEQAAIKDEEERIEKAFIQQAEQEAIGTLVDDIILDEQKASKEEEEEQEVPGVGNMDNAFNVEGKTANSMNSEEVFKLYLKMAQGEDSQIVNVDHDPDSKMVTIDMESGTKLVDTGDLIGVDAPKGEKPSDKDIETLVRGVKLRNWRGMQLEGSEEFKARVWLEAQRQGVRPIGYSPPNEVRALWEAEKATHKPPVEQKEKDVPEAEKTNAEEASIEAEEANIEIEEVSKEEHKTEHKAEPLQLKEGQQPVALLPEKAESLQEQDEQLQLAAGQEPPKQLMAGQENSVVAQNNNNELQKTNEDMSMKRFNNCMDRSFEGKSTNEDKVFIKAFLNSVDKMHEDEKSAIQSKMQASVKKLMKDSGAEYHGTDAEQQSIVVQQSMALLNNMLKEKPVDIKAKTLENTNKPKNLNKGKVNAALSAAKRNQRGG